MFVIIYLYLNTNFSTVKGLAVILLTIVASKCIVNKLKFCSLKYKILVATDKRRLDSDFYMWLLWW